MLRRMRHCVQRDTVLTSVSVVLFRTRHRFSARPDMTTLPLSHPDRTDTGFRPFKALRHFRKLIADKEDTEQVFHIIDARRDKRFGSSVEQFSTKPEGKRVLAERPYLPEIGRAPCRERVGQEA